MGHRNIETTIDIYAEATDRKNRNRLKTYQNWISFEKEFSASEIDNKYT